MNYERERRLRMNAYVETRKAANYYQISEPKSMVKEDMEKKIAMLNEKLKKVKAEKDEMEKALKTKIKKLQNRDC